MYGANNAIELAGVCCCRKREKYTSDHSIPPAGSFVVALLRMVLRYLGNSPNRIDCLISLMMSR